MRRRKKQTGFLLVEILVALVILAIPLAAITRAVSQAIDTTAALRDRNIAIWVAQDRLTMHRIERDWPSLKTTTGTSEMADRSWRWQERSSVRRLYSCVALRSKFATKMGLTC